MCHGMRPPVLSYSISRISSLASVKGVTVQPGHKSWRRCSQWHTKPKLLNFLAIEVPGSSVLWGLKCILAIQLLV